MNKFFKIQIFVSCIIFNVNDVYCKYSKKCSSKYNNKDNDIIEDTKTNNNKNKKNDEPSKTPGGQHKVPDEQPINPGEQPTNPEEAHKTPEEEHKEIKNPNKNLEKPKDDNITLEKMNNLYNEVKKLKKEYNHIYVNVNEESFDSKSNEQLANSYDAYSKLKKILEDYKEYYDKCKTGTILSFYDTIPKENTSENKLNTDGINVTLKNFEDFKFSYSDRGDDKETELQSPEDTFITDLIKELLCKRGVENGNFEVGYIKPEHFGVNPIFKAKITNTANNNVFHVFIKKDKNSDIEHILKGFEILELLPFKYAIKINQTGAGAPDKYIITEDISENGYNFLHDEYEGDKLKQNNDILNKIKNINEFRFWCYILLCDDIDPYCKFDNVCYKEDKIYPLDVRFFRNNDFFNIYRHCEELSIKETKYEKYNEKFNEIFKLINTDDMTKWLEGRKKYYDEKTSIFNGFTDEEKKNINEKFPKLLNWVFGNLKNKNIDNIDSNFKIPTEDYFFHLLYSIYCIYKLHYSILNNVDHDPSGNRYYINDIEQYYIDPKLSNEISLSDYKRCIKCDMKEYTYENLNYQFKVKLEENVKENKFKFVLDNDNIIKLYDVYNHIKFIS